MLALVLLAVLASDPADFVRSLYANAGAAGPDPVFDVTSREALRKTFEGPIVELIWRDLVDAQGEVGRMDAHYLFDAQDDEIANLRIKTLENAADRARVLATFDFPSSKGSAEFHLLKTSGGWRVSNIVYARGTSYMDILNADFPMPKIEDERSAAALCGMYAEYELALPESYDAEDDARELAELFANGEGAKQDFGAAIHVLCGENTGLADAEKWSMLDHVLRMERGATDEPLDFCAHATSTSGGIICAARREDEERPLLDARYAAVRAKAGNALDALRKQADKFIEADAHWENETMRGGTIYTYIGTHTKLDRDAKFVELIEKYSASRAAAASDADFQRADADLNAAYRERLAELEAPDTDHLRAAQRAWIAYRDAWIVFYQQRWSGAASPDALRREIATALTRERIAELGRV